jgi:membrane protease YdiL (CAAX protease family)
MVGDPPQAVGWRRGVVAALLLVLLSQLVYGLGEVGRIETPREVPGWGRGAIGCAVALALAAGAIALVLWLALRRGRARPDAYGLAEPRRTTSSVLLFVLATLVLAPIAVAITVALGLHGTTAIDLKRRALSDRVFVTFAAVVLAPWFEELSMRGLLYSALERRFNFWTAAVVSGLVWSGAHLRGGVLIVFTLEGVLLAALRRRTGSLLPGVGLHGGWNALAAWSTGGGQLVAAMLALLFASLAASAAALRRRPDAR